MSSGYRLEQRIVDDIVSRLRQHVDSIAKVDWDYFAALRFRDEGRLAVSDLERLVRHMDALAAPSSVRAGRGNEGE